MAVFVCKLSHKDQSDRLVVNCTVVGEEHGYETHQREFNNAAHATKALSEAGIGRDRFGPIPEDAKPDWSCSFEISHNEAQKLDVLHVDSTE
jgi:hypothetical protein